MALLPLAGMSGLPFGKSYPFFRDGASIAAVLWIVAASWRGKGALRVIGLLLALDIIIYTFIITSVAPSLFYLYSFSIVPFSL